MNEEYPISRWLPISKKEVEGRGWDELDVILFSGDAYVDHPAFGHAVVGRLIEQEGLRVAIVPQPNWRDDLRDFTKLGKPTMFFGVTSGCMDSMVNHYTANRRLRSNDAYTPGGHAGFRPDRAASVYAQILKKLYPDVPVVLGGIEASLRRVTHYDYWDDELKPTILADSGADLLVYGMGELPLRMMINLLKKGVPFSSLKTIPQTAFMQDLDESLPKNKHWGTKELVSHEQCLASKRDFASNFKIVEQESNKVQADRIIQTVGNQRLVINPPTPPMSEEQIDASFDLPFTRMPHPRYKKRGAIPAYNMIRFSLNMHRGCFGGCSFCTISAHQGKFIASRSKESIMKEVEQITQMPDFRGTISDMGGPSANMYKLEGKDPSICERCVSPSCIHPVVCHNLDTNHLPMLDIYREVSAHPDVKHSFVGSGIRYDLLVQENADEETRASHKAYMEEIVKNHVSGRLKVAPEHTADETLKIMRKPSFSRFHKFKEEFDRINQENQLKQQLVPYFISSHPGCSLEDMAELAAETKDMGFELEQVQDFTPTPMTVATVIYYSGFHPYTLQPVETPISKKEKLAQRQFFFWHQSKNHESIRTALESAQRPDLIEKLLPDSASDTPESHRRGRRLISHAQRRDAAQRKKQERPQQGPSSRSDRSNGSSASVEDKGSQRPRRTINRPKRKSSQRT